MTRTLPRPLRLFLVLSAAKALAFVGAVGLFGTSACSEEANALHPDATVERARMERIVVATGTIEPSREVEVRPRIAGIVERIHVDAGDRVDAGTALVDIERELLESQVREARAALREAQAALRFAKLTIGRANELHTRGATSNQSRDEANVEYERATARVAAANARLDTLRTQLSYASVRSPLAGRVLDVHTEEGNAVSPVTSVTGGTLLISLAGTDALHLEGLVDENEIARLEVGQAARIRTEAYGDRIFEGVLREIAPLGQRIENVTYFEVEVEVTDAEAQLLRPRMSGDAEIVTEILEDALVVPETALLYRGDTIYVEQPGADRSDEARTTPVEIGVVDGDRVQILSGLSAGETVLLQ